MPSVSSRYCQVCRRRKRFEKQSHGVLLLLLLLAMLVFRGLELLIGPLFAVGVIWVLAVEVPRGVECGASAHGIVRRLVTAALVLAVVGDVVALLLGIGRA